jgi:PhnB protein
MIPPADSSAPKVKPVPDNYPIVSPYICIRDASAAIEFYKKAFGAKERFRMAGPDGKVGHAEIEIAGGVIMLADEYPQMDFHSPQKYGGSSVIIHCYVPDVDALAKQASAAGATILRPVTDQFYGDRSVSLADPFGHKWSFATHIEDVSPEEMQRRSKEKMGG